MPRGPSELPVYNMEPLDLWKRKKRITYTLHQLHELEELFKTNQYPNEILRQQVANNINVDEHRVKVWFQNRRARSVRDAKMQSCSRGHQSQVVGNNLTESLRGTNSNETSSGIININNSVPSTYLRPDSGGRTEERASISCYLENFYEPKYVGYPI